MPGPIRVVHFLNQVYAGIGREEKADLPVEVRDRPIGPARLLNYLLGERGEVICTIICGDGYFAGQRGETLTYIESQLRGQQPDVLVAGPAFDLEAYGLACVAVCAEALKLGIASATAIAPNNPANARCGPEVTIVPTGPAPGDMMATISQLVPVVLKGLDLDGQVPGRESPRES